MTITDDAYAPEVEPAHLLDEQAAAEGLITPRSRPTAPPHDTNMERAVLGAMLLSNDACEAATSTGLQPEDFHTPRHGHIYQAITNLHHAGDHIDHATVAAELARTDHPEITDRHLYALQSEVITTRGAAKYATVVRTHALARRLAAELHAASEAAYTGQPDEALRLLQRTLDTLPAEDGDTWQPEDLTAVLAGDIQVPAPDICKVTGAAALFYRGRTNSIFGPPGGAKTWITQHAIAETITAGGTAMFIDFEDDATAMVARLRLLGLDPDQILTNFIYVRPDRAWTASSQQSVGKLVTDRAPDLVVIDSTGESMAIDGVSGNDDDEVARWFTSFPSYLARLGPAVVLIDHVVKDPNAPKDYAIGSQRKRAAIHGAAYRIDTIKEPSRTTDGLLSITTAKDRHGHHTKGQKAALVHMTHPYGDDHVQVALVAPEAPPKGPDGEFRPTHVMEQLSIALEATPGLSGRQLEERVRGKGKVIREAIRLLIIEDYVGQVNAARGFAYEVLKPYRESADPKVVHADPGDAEDHDDPPMEEF